MAPPLSHARALLAGFAVVLGACHDVELERVEGARCTTGDDCRSSLCALEHCRERCEADHDCAGGACLVLDEPTRACTVPRENGCTSGGPSACPPGLDCGADGVCRNRCDARHPCSAERSCFLGTCFDAVPDAGL